MAVLKPSENNRTSAISSLSGTDIAIGLKSCFKLSGSFDLPPYPLPAGFKVTKMPELKFTTMSLPKRWICFCFDLIASWIIWICWEIADNCYSNKRLN